MARINKRIAITCIFVVIVIGAFIYRRDRPIVAGSDNSILTKQPCVLPCWYGLTPGVSSLETVQPVMLTIPLITEADLADERTVNGEYYLSRGASSSAFSGVTFRFRNNILYAINVSPNIDYTLQDILERYGTPAGITMDYSTGSPEMLGAIVDITLYYPTSGLVVTFDIYRGELGKSKYEIRPDARGGRFYILPESQTLEELVSYYLTVPVESAKASIWSQFVTEWPGLYSSIIDPTFPQYDRPLVTPHIQLATSTP